MPNGRLPMLAGHSFLSLVLVCSVAAGVGVAAATHPLETAAGTAVGWAVLSAWVAGRSLGASTLIIAAAAVLMAGLVVPSGIRAALDIALILGVGYLLVSFRRQNWMTVAASAAFLILAWDVVLLATSSNVPSLYVGSVGIRATLVAPMALFLGYFLGIRIGTTRISKLAHGITLVLLAGAISGLVVHLWAPSIEQSFFRAAGTATSEFAGAERLQGLLAGPFHMAMLGSFLFIAGVRGVVFTRRPIAPLLLLVGALVLYYARVRTGYVVCGAGLLLVVAQAVRAGLLRSGNSDRVLRASVLLASVGVITFATFQTNPVTQSITTIGSDSRVASRAASFEEATSLYERSWIAGWGPGAATSGLEEDFGSGVHVTPHNGLLLVLFESGVVGGTLFLGMVTAMFLSYWRSRNDVDGGRDEYLVSLAFAGALSLVGFWIPSDGLAALPVSALLAFVCGCFLAVAHDASSA